MHAIKIGFKKEVMDLKESREGYMGGFRGRKRKGETLQLNYNLNYTIWFPRQVFSGTHFLVQTDLEFTEIRLSLPP